MRMTLITTAVLVTLNVGTASAQNKVTRSIAVDSSFQDANMNWTGATPGGYKAMIALKGNKGVFELCGVGVTTNIQLRPSIENMLRGGKLQINGKTVLTNFRYFAKAKRPSSMKATKANCVATNMKVQKIESVDFLYGDGTFRN